MESLHYVSFFCYLFFCCEKLWERPPDDGLWKREEPDGSLRLWSVPLCEAQEPENVHRLPPLCHQVVSSRRLPFANASETDVFTHDTKKSVGCKMLNWGLKMQSVWHECLSLNRISVYKYRPEDYWINVDTDHWSLYYGKTSQFYLIKYLQIKQQQRFLLLVNNDSLNVITTKLDLPKYSIHIKKKDLAFGFSCIVGY